MAGVEMFTLLAIFDAVDRASKTITKIDKSFQSVAASAERAAGIVTESGAVIDKALLDTASGEDAVQLASARLSAAQTAQKVATDDLAGAELSLLDVQKKIADGALVGADAINAQTAALDRLNVAEIDAAKVAKVASDAQARLDATQLASTASADKSAKSQGVLGKVAALNTGVMGKVLNTTIAAGAAVAGIGYESIKTAANYETLTTRLVTSANEQTTNLNYVRQAMMDVAVQTGTTASQLAKSMYVVESAGYHGKDGIDVLRAATEGATQEGADFGNVANAVTDVLKDYHLQASQASNVTSQMVEAVAQGKTNFQAFSFAMGNILPTASAMNISFADVSGVLAEMTNHGMSAQRASMNMANALRNLSGPTSGMTKEFKLLGGSTDELQQKLHGPNGLTDAMNYASQIAQKAGQVGTPAYVDALHKLMGTASGLSVALMTTGKNTAETAGGIAQIGKASADAQGNVQGFSKVQDTLAFKIGQAKAAIDNTGIAIGTALIPVVTKLILHINNVVIPISKWIENHQKLVGLIMTAIVILGTLAGAIKLVAIASGILNTILEANPFVLITLAIIALVVGLIYAWNHFKTFRDVVTTVFNAVKNAAIDVWHALETAWHAVADAAMWVWHQLQAAWNGVVTGVLWVWHQIEDAWNAVAKVTTTVWDAIAGFFKKWWPLLLVIFMPFIAVLISIWNHFHTQIIGGIESAWNHIKSFLSAAWDDIKSAAKMAWNLIRDYIIQPIENAWAVIKYIWGIISPWLSSIWRNIASMASTVWGFIKDAMISPLTDAWHTITGIINNIANTIWNGLVSAWNTVKDVGSWFLQIGSDIVNGIITGIENAASSLFNSLSNLATNALNSAKSFLGIGSPSKVFREEVGKWIVHGVAEGVIAYSGVAEKAVSGMVTALPGAVGGPAGAAAARGVGAGLAAAGGLTYTAMTPGAAGNMYYFDLRESKIMSDRDMDQLVNKIGNRLAVTTLPSGGVRIRA